LRQSFLKGAPENKKKRQRYYYPLQVQFQKELTAHSSRDQTKTYFIAADTLTAEITSLSRGQAEASVM